MKICVTATGSNLNSMIDPRFGRCQYLLFIDSKIGKLIKTEKNTGAQSLQGAGVTTAQIVVDNKAEIVITGNVGPNAFNVLEMSGVKIYPGVLDSTVKQAIEKFQKGQLKSMVQPTVGGHFGMGTGWGQKAGLNLGGRKGSISGNGHGRRKGDKLS